MSDFYSFDLVKARKPHECAHCRTPIAVGETYRKIAQVFEGEFDSYCEHSECYAAWLEYRDAKALNWDEGSPFIKDDDGIDVEEREWFREHHELVAERMKWTAARPHPEPTSTDSDDAGCVRDF